MKITYECERQLNRIKGDIYTTSSNFGSLESGGNLFRISDIIL